MNSYVFNIYAPDGEPPLEFQAEPEAAHRILEALSHYWADAEVVMGSVEGPQYQGKLDDHTDLFLKEFLHYAT